MLRTGAEKFNFGFIKPENYASYSLRVLQMTWSKLQVGFHLSFTDDFTDQWQVAVVVVFLEGSPISTQNLWRSE